MTDALSEDAQFDLLGRLAQALVQAASPQVVAEGTFPPLGGLLIEGPQVQLVNITAEAQPGQTITPDMLMPAVHQAIQQMTKQIATDAVATATPTTIDLGEGEMPAFKVMCEHRDGLCVVFHIPWSRTEGGTLQMHPADAEEVDSDITDWR